MEKKSVHDSKIQSLVFSDLNNKYIKLKYRLKIHRRKSMLLYKKFTGLYKKYWEMYDFITARSFDRNENDQGEYKIIEDYEGVDAALPYKLRQV